MSVNKSNAKYTFSYQSNEEHAAYVTYQLAAFNKSRKSSLWEDPPQPQGALQIFILDDNNSVIGGLIGRTNTIPEWLEVSVIWVREEARGLGLGGQLMQRAEEEATRRSCRYVRLSSSDFQGPDFYYKLGYKLYGKLENCPHGETVYFFSKELV